VFKTLDGAETTLLDVLLALAHYKQPVYYLGGFDWITGGQMIAKQY
jgi:hypothetical protein